MIPVPYVCKFCGHNGTAKFDETCGCPPIDLAKWASMIVCNRCADYERARRDVEEAIVRAARTLISSRLTIEADSPKLKASEAVIEVKLTVLTKKFAEIVCNRFNKPLHWEPMFVDAFMRKPEQASSYLYGYARRYSRKEVEAPLEKTL